MLYLLININKETVALLTKDVLEIIPIVQIRPIHNAPEHVAGEINYRGSTVIVLDLEKMHSAKPTEYLLSTRIIMVNYQGSILGLLAQEVTDTVEINEENFLPNSGTIDGVTPDRCAKINNITITCHEVSTLIDSYKNSDEGKE